MHQRTPSHRRLSRWLPCCGVMVSCETKGRPIRLQAHSTRIWRGDRKPLNPAARDRVRQKATRAHVRKCSVDQPKAIRAIERYGDGLWHPIKVVVQHSQSGNIAHGTGEPLPTTRKSYDLSVFEPLDGIVQRVVRGGAYPSGCQMLLQPHPNAIVGVDANDWPARSSSLTECSGESARTSA